MLHKESVLPRNESVGCYCGGVVNWRTAVVHYVAKAVGIHVKVEGFPLGTNRNLESQKSVAFSGSSGVGAGSIGRVGLYGRGGAGRDRRVDGDRAV